MQLSLKIIILVFGLVFLAVFISLMRNKNIKPFYSSLWLIVSIFMISLVLFERFYKWIATALGISDASFLIILGLIAFLMAYVLHISIKISQMSDRIQELISYTSILEYEIRKLKKSSKIDSNYSSKT